MARQFSTHLCAYCGIPFQALLSEIKQGGGKYCSNRCVGYAHRGVNMVDCVCRQCGITFQVHNARVQLGEGLYCSRVCATSANRVPLAKRFWHHVQRCEHEDLCIFCCWPWLGKHTRGYGKITVNKQELLAHRQSWALHHGVPYPPSLLIIRHLCHYPPCCNPAHLASGSVKDNTRDRILAGRTFAGEKHPHAKLTEEQVRAIYALCLEGISYTLIAAQFSVSRSLISNISQKKTWTHLLDDTTVAIPLRHSVHGEKHAKAKLIDRQIQEIRALHMSGLSFVALGRLYDVSDETIRMIVHRVTWKHVD